MKRGTKLRLARLLALTAVVLTLSLDLDSLWRIVAAVSGLHVVLTITDLIARDLKSSSALLTGLMSSTFLHLRRRVDDLEAGGRLVARMYSDDENVRAAMDRHFVRHAAKDAT